MLSIRVCDIPKFLHSSLIYATFLEANAGKEIIVPEECYKSDDSVESFSEFCKLLKVINYWGVYSFPQALIQYCDTSNFAAWNNIAELTLKDNPHLYTDLAAVFAKPSTITSKIIRSMQIGRVELLEYFAECDEFSDCLSATTFACSIGRVDYLTVLHKYSFSWDEITCSTAAKYGSLDCLIYAHENGCRWDSGVICEAAERGCFECMQYALESGCPHSPISCTYAAAYGQLGCLQLLYCHGAPLNADAATAAAAGGHLDCLTFLHDKGCLWNADVVSKAAQNGHKDCLVFALENGCAVAPDACLLAAGAGHLLCWCILHDLKESNND